MAKAKSKQPIPSNRLEEEYRGHGYRVVAGLDEVGRGAWAGPLVMGAVVLPPKRRMLGLRDSKLLTRREREVLARRIRRLAVTWALGIVTVEELNAFGLAKGLMLAAQRAVAGLAPLPDIVLVDGPHQFRDLAIPQQAIVKGDMTIQAIAAASVLAKVARDQMMRTLHRDDQSVRLFRFDQNKGYPSPWHRATLAKAGPSVHHRLSFQPVKRSQNQMLFIDKPEIV